MKQTITIILFLSHLFLKAQEDVVKRTSDFITTGKYAEASQYLDSILKREPRNIDALMMQGNVLLNYSLSKTDPIGFISAADETIYSTEAPSLKSPSRIIKQETILNVEKLWKACLELDSTRLDIRMGLCAMYAMGLMKESLLNELPKVVRFTNRGEEFAYILASYARMFKERGDLNGAYEVYKKIASLYPTNSGMVSDIAAEYLSNGDLNNAVLYAEKATAMPKADLTTYLNAVDVYSTVGDLSKAAGMYKKAQKDSTFKDYLFYKALLGFSKRDTSWKTDMGRYANTRLALDSSVYNEIAKFMLSQNFKNSYLNYMQLMSLNLNSFCVQALTSRAMVDFKDSIEPRLIYAEGFVFNRNYVKANVLFQNAAFSKLDEGSKEDYELYSAYSLYQSKNYVLAEKKWNNLATTQDVFKKQAAQYFTANILLQKKDIANAKSVLMALAKSDPPTKYAELAKVKLGGLE